MLLLYPPWLEFIAAFLWRLYAGAIAVPAYPPRVNSSGLRLMMVDKPYVETLALRIRECLDEAKAIDG
jgi:hypothetical protein